MSKFASDYPKFTAALKLIVCVISVISFSGGFAFGVLMIGSALTGGAHIYVTGVKK